jgi:NADH-quinone oxidoreductase subunit N
MADALLFAPEIALIATGLLLFFCPVFETKYSTAWALALLGGLLSLAAALWTLGQNGEPFAPGIYRVDYFSQLIKAALALGFVLVVAISHQPNTLDRSAWVEFPMFLLFATLGAMMMVSATELLTLYISIELAAYPLYIVVALHRNTESSGESSTKYMLQGMMGSAVSLYGMSFLYGIFASTYFSEITRQLPAAAGQPLLWVGLVLLLAGFLFKLGSFPFHFWLPDIYQTAPHEVVAYLATVSKVAAIAMLCRLVSLFADAQMPEVLMWLSVAAMTLGNFAALVQKDLKRLLGYSAVAHAGYILLAVQTGALLGFSAALFYALGYLLMSFICFLVVCELGRDSDAVSVESLRGLHHRSPLLAASLMVGLFGLIGLPPTVGFIGKWFLFSAAIEQGQFGLVLVAAVNTVVALYYYLLVLRAAYLEDAPDAAMIQLRPIVRITALVSIAAVLALGTFPGRFWAMAARAAEALG